MALPTVVTTHTPTRHRTSNATSQAPTGGWGTREERRPATTPQSRRFSLWVFSTQGWF
jgi:hypothetical protein